MLSMAGPEPDFRTRAANHGRLENGRRFARPMRLRASSRRELKLKDLMAAKNPADTSSSSRTM